MKRFTYLMLGLSVVFSILLIIGFLLPSQFEISRTVHMKTSPEKVYNYLNDLRTWESWTVWNKRKDPSLTISYSANTIGVGASQKWQGEQIGDGELTLTESVPVEGVWFDLLLQKKTFVSKGSVTYQMIGEHELAVTWKMTGDLGDNPILRYLGLGLNRMVGKDFEENLNNLKQVVE
ncbi:MAG: SRPBCC family protein [Chitinophagales bacterium]